MIKILKRVQDDILKNMKRVQYEILMKQAQDKMLAKRCHPERVSGCFYVQGSHKGR